MLPTRSRGGAAAPLSSRFAFRPRLLPLENREVPSTTTTTTDTTEPPPPPDVTEPVPAVVAPPVLAVGSDSGFKPGVRVYEASTGEVKFSFLAYEPAFKGGVRVATGDVTGDGVPDLVTAPGPGRAPLVKLYDGTDGTLLTQFMAYDTKFTGGVYVAVGDVNGDGQADITTGAGEKGGPHVKIFNGSWVEPPAPTPVTTTTTTTPTTTDTTPTTTDTTTDTTTTPDTTTTTTTTTPTVVGVPPEERDTQTQLLRQFMAYDKKFTGGVRMANGDVNGDGKSDVVTAAGTGGAPHVRIFSGADGTQIRSFFAFVTNFTGGVYVSAGDLDGDGKAEVVASTGPNGGARVRSFSGATGLTQRTFDTLNVPGNMVAKVAVMDYDQDGTPDILTSVGRQVQVRNGRTGKVKSTINVSDANIGNGLNL